MSIAIPSTSRQSRPYLEFLNIEQNKSLVLRFCFLGTSETSIVNHRGNRGTEDIEEKLTFLNSLMIVGAEETLFKMVEKVMKSSIYSPNSDQCIILLAYFVRQESNIKLREMVYRNAHTLLKTDRELFAFIRYTQRFNKKINPNSLAKTKGFGRGIRRVISNWYTQKTPLQLVELLYRHRSFYGWSHKDLICMAHVKFGDDIEKKFIINAMSNRSYKMLKKTELDPSTVPRTVACEKLIRILKLKVSEDPNEVGQQLINVGGDIERSHIPVIMFDDLTFWLKIINQLSFKLVFNLLFTLHEMNLLKTNDELSKKWSLRLVKKNPITSSKVQPLEILSTINAYSRNKRYQETVKQKWHTKLRVERRNLEVNKTIVTKLKTALNISLANLPTTGCTFIITLDLRKTNTTRSVYNMRHLSCIDAMALFALNYTKKEKTTVYAFTDTLNKLNKMEFTPCENFQEALSKCTKVAMLGTRTAQSLEAPVRLATSKGPTMFITIMDSVARICRDGMPYFDDFIKYRVKHKKSKYIVLNLARHQPDLYPRNARSTSTEGLLEICGLSPDTPRVIAAFVSNQFS